MDFNLIKESGNGIEMCRMSHEEEGGGQSQGANEQDLEMAHHLVPRMESVPKRARRQVTGCTT
jgi:hypothetical protein